MVDIHWGRLSTLRDELSMRSLRLKDDLEEVLRKLSTSATGETMTNRKKRLLSLGTYSAWLCVPTLLLGALAFFATHHAALLVRTGEAMQTSVETSLLAYTLGGALSKEMEASLLYLANKTDSRQGVLSLRHAATDSLLRSQQIWVPSQCQTRATYLQSAPQLGDYLAAYRNIIESVSSSTEYDGQFYRDICQQIITCMTSLLNNLPSSELLDELIILGKLIRGSTRLALFTAGQVVLCTRNDALAYHREIDLALADIAAANFIRSGGTQWSSSLAKVVRSAFLAAPPGQAFCGENATHSLQIEAALLHRTTMTLAANVTSRLATRRRHMLRVVMADACAVSLALTVFLPAICYYVHVLMQSKLTFRAALRRVSSHLRDEQARSMFYLKTMVPHSLALELQRSDFRTMPRPLSQPEVTVMYLTLTGLPMTFDFSEADSFLNIMSYVYRLVEERVSLYRVYVLHRTANHYLIASDEGSSETKAVEVANLALDLLTSCSDLEISHIRDSRIQLSMGIHTGPCMAVMVHQWPPLYLLMGRTVDAAKYLEALSAPNGIQISETTQAILDKTGFYNIRWRGNENTEVNDATAAPMMTSQQNQETSRKFWLLGRKVSFVNENGDSQNGSRTSSQLLRAVPIEPQGATSNVSELEKKAMYKFDSEDNSYMPRLSYSVWCQSPNRALGCRPSGRLSRGSRAGSAGPSGSSLSSMGSYGSWGSWVSKSSWGSRESSSSSSKLSPRSDKFPAVFCLPEEEDDLPDVDC